MSSSREPSSALPHKIDPVGKDSVGLNTFRLHRAVISLFLVRGIRTLLTHLVHETNGPFPGGLARVH